MTPTTCPNCGIEVVSGSRGRPRRFCSRACTITFHRPKPKHSVEYHELTAIDEQARTATCSVCGPAAKVWKGGTRRERWRCANRVKLQNSRRWQEDPVKARERKWASRGIVGMTVERYDRMLAEQGGLCAICRAEMKQVCVDHCHDGTGLVRGLLCTGCNTGLGKFGDNIEGVQRLVTYLEAFLEREGLVD